MSSLQVYPLFFPYIHRNKEKFQENLKKADGNSKGTDRMIILFRSTAPAGRAAGFGGAAGTEELDKENKMHYCIIEIRQQYNDTKRKDE